MPDFDSSENRTAESVFDAAAQAGAVDLYEDQMAAYHEALGQGMEVAERRFGFVLYHSLPGSEVTALRQQMGFQPAAATDFYNLGVVAAENGDFAEAIQQFQKALQADPELSEAEYNLALAQENAGEKSTAKKIWSSYIKRDSISEADRTAVAEHLKELG